MRKQSTLTLEFSQDPIICLSLDARRSDVKRSCYSLCVLLFFCTVLGLTACRNIDDTNGETDTSLSQITDEELYGHNIGWSATGLNTQSRRNVARTSNYYANEGFRETDDYDFYKVSCKSASGTTNLIATKLDDGEMAVFEVESQISSGNLKVVLLKRGEKTDELVYEFETGQTDAFELIPDGFGIYYVRAGVESFGGEIIVTREVSESSK